MGADTIAMVQLVSYDEMSGQVGLLGVAIYPLFIENGKDHFLNSGHYHVPVFWSTINEYMDIDDAFALPKIPGLSLLVTCQSKLDEDDIPDY